MLTARVWRNQTSLTSSVRARSARDHFVPHLVSDQRTARPRPTKITDAPGPSARGWPGVPQRPRRSGTSCADAPRRPSEYTSSNVINHRICSGMDTPQPCRNPTTDSRRGTLPTVIRLWTVAREMGIPTSRLRRATLSSERPRASINARRRRANSAGVAAPMGSGGTGHVVTALTNLPRPDSPRSAASGHGDLRSAVRCKQERSCVRVRSTVDLD